MRAVHNTNQVKLKSLRLLEIGQKDLVLVDIDRTIQHRYRNQRAVPGQLVQAMSADGDTNLCIGLVSEAIGRKLKCTAELVRERTRGQQERRRTIKLRELRIENRQILAILHLFSHMVYQDSLCDLQ